MITKLMDRTPEMFRVGTAVVALYCETSLGGTLLPGRWLPGVVVRAPKEESSLVWAVLEGSPDMHYDWIGQFFSPELLTLDEFNFLCKTDFTRRKYFLDAVHTMPEVEASRFTILLEKPTLSPEQLGQELFDEIRRRAAEQEL